MFLFILVVEPINTISYSEADVRVMECNYVAWNISFTDSVLLI